MKEEKGKRAEQNRKIRREALREELKSREYLRQIHKLIEAKTIDDVQISKFRVDAYFKLLAKTLPDVKAIELTGEDGKDLLPPTIKLVHE